ncbi:glycosyltransferase family 2 protein [Desulfolutivibrio sulfoxidireducens]|uniref:glycosyltransferase family 2 protein n=1 Tax=Desulfolutivibrio sulfoxidireducens TaxID=2773299 RepID=UPI00159E2430|nr:glycosyltransferase family 2 protein [Desulfolutivibrio sulfoxidireducens]QLA17815.1 glycosyltransferase [Desulfolutivibrio sulfoxidireducens]
MDHNVSIILPTFNEEDCLESLIGRIRAVNPDWEIIVADDASTDRSVDVATRCGATVVRHTYNLGNGAAVRTGAAAASRDTLVFMDADGQHPPEIIPRLLESMRGYDMLVASRTRESTTQRFRNFGNAMLRMVASRLSGWDIPDLTSGFRVVRRECFFEFAHLFPLRYSYPTTITMAMLCSGRFVRFEAAPEITSRKAGESNIHPLRDGLRFLKIIVRIVMLFHPARIFLPLASTIFGLGVVSALLQLYFTGGIHNLSLFLLQTGVITFLVALISEQISMLRISHRSWGRRKDASGDDA